MWVLGWMQLPAFLKINFTWHWSQLVVSEGRCGHCLICRNPVKSRSNFGSTDPGCNYCAHLNFEGEERFLGSCGKYVFRFCALSKSLCETCVHMCDLSVETWVAGRKNRHAASFSCDGCLLCDNIIISKLSCHWQLVLWWWLLFLLYLILRKHIIQMFWTTMYLIKSSPTVSHSSFFIKGVLLVIIFGMWFFWWKICWTISVKCKQKEQWKKDDKQGQCDC